MDISDNWALGLADILPEPQQSSVDQYRVVDLFAGCGGLALGFGLALGSGFCLLPALLLLLLLLFLFALGSDLP